MTIRPYLFLSISLDIMPSLIEKMRHTANSYPIQWQTLIYRYSEKAGKGGGAGLAKIFVGFPDGADRRKRRSSELRKKQHGTMSQVIRQAIE